MRALSYASFLWNHIKNTFPFIILFLSFLLKNPTFNLFPLLSITPQIMSQYTFIIIFDKWDLILICFVIAKHLLNNFLRFYFIVEIFYSCFIDRKILGYYLFVKLFSLFPVFNNQVVYRFHLTFCAFISRLSRFWGFNVALINWEILLYLKFRNWEI